MEEPRAAQGHRPYSTRKLEAKGEGWRYSGYRLTPLRRRTTTTREQILVMQKSVVCEPHTTLPLLIVTVAGLATCGRGLCKPSERGHCCGGARAMVRAELCIGLSRGQSASVSTTWP